MIRDLVKVVVTNFFNYVVQDISDGKSFAKNIKEEGIQKVANIVIELLSKTHNEEIVRIIWKFVTVHNAIREVRSNSFSEIHDWQIPFINTEIWYVIRKVDEFISRINNIVDAQHRTFD